MYRVSLSTSLPDGSEDEDELSHLLDEQQLQQLQQRPSHGGGAGESPLETISTNANGTKKTHSSEYVSLKSNPQETIRELYAFASTESEAVFILDATHSPPHLELSNSNLTVKNTSTKRWCTCRATVRLTSGLHRWDVRVDRFV